MRTRLFQRGILQQKVRGVLLQLLRVISSCPACPDLQRCWSSRTSTSDSGRRELQGPKGTNGTSWGRGMKCVRPLFQFLDSVLDQMSTCKFAQLTLEHKSVVAPSPSSRRAWCTPRGDEPRIAAFTRLLCQGRASCRHAHRVVETQVSHAAEAGEVVVI